MLRRSTPAAASVFLAQNGRPRTHGDATVESILPEFGELQVLDGFDGDEPRLRAPAGKATVSWSRR